MADITMCVGIDSVNAKCVDCYRKNAIPNEYRQAYFMVVPMDKNGECDSYWQYPKVNKDE